MKHFKVYVGLAVAMLFAACQSDVCKVKGTVAFHDGAMLLIAPSVANDMPTSDSLQVCPTDTVAVAEGTFRWQTKADTARLYRICPSNAPQQYVTFFAERGTVTISFDSTTARVSGTYLNDQWQALNDAIAEDAQRIDRTVRTLIAANTPPSLVNRRITQLYDEIEKLVASTAERNKDNELGRLLHSH